MRVTIFAFVVATILCSPYARAADDEQLNVIVLLVDDLGWTDLGCFGSDLYETTNPEHDPTRPTGTARNDGTVREIKPYRRE